MKFELFILVFAFCVCLTACTSKRNVTFISYETTEEGYMLKKYMLPYQTIEQIDVYNKDKSRFLVLKAKVAVDLLGWACALRCQNQFCKCFFASDCVEGICDGSQMDTCADRCPGQIYVAGGYVSY